MRPDPFAWSLHLEASAAIAVLCLAYVLALRRHPASPARIAAFAAGALLLLVAAVSPLEALTFHLLSAHLLQNVILAEWAPALLVAGIPRGLARPLGELPLVGRLTNPFVALPLWLVTYFFWHVPAAYDAALRHPATLLHLEHASYLATGVLFWWPLLQDEPRRLSPQRRAGYVFGAFLLASPLGLLLALLPEPVYDFYDGFGRWDISALTDQQIAGVTMAGEEAIVFFAAFTFFFFRFLAEEERVDHGTNRA